MEPQEETEGPGAPAALSHPGPPLPADRSAALQPTGPQGSASRASPGVCTEPFTAGQAATNTVSSDSRVITSETGACPPRSSCKIVPSMHSSFLLGLWKDLERISIMVSSHRLDGSLLKMLYLKTQFSLSLISISDGTIPRRDSPSPWNWNASTFCIQVPGSLSSPPNPRTEACCIV